MIVGQKVNPHGLRVGVIKGWESNWFADKDYENSYWKILKSVSSLKKNYSCPEFPK